MMNSRKLWINSPLLKNIIKNNLFPAKVSLITFIGIFALTLLSGIGSNIGILCIFVFAISAVVLTTIYPCYLQSYLIDKTKAAIMSSLPLDTKCVWFTNYLAGYLIALVTLLIEGTGIIVLIGYQGNCNFGRFILAIVMLLFIYYTMAYLVCCISGNRLGQVIFSLTAYVLPLVFVVVMIFIGPKVVPALEMGIDEHILYLIFPLGAGMDFIYNGSTFIFLHLIISIGLMALSYYIYKNRDNEYIGEPLVFHQIIIVLKAILVLIATICGFSIILLLVDMNINYGLLGISSLLLIYMLVGVVASIIVEIIFKGKYIYRHLLIYMPILAIVFGINYYVANQSYIDTVVNYQGKMESTISFNNDDNHSLLRMEEKATKAFQKYLSEHREMIYYIKNSDDSRLASFICYQIDQDYSYWQSNYRFDKEALVDFFKGPGKQYFDHIYDIMDALKEEKYLIYYDYNDNIYLLDNEIDQLIRLIDNSVITPESIYKVETISFTGSSGKEYPVVSNEAIVDFLKSDKFYQRGDFIESCQRFFNNIISNENHDYDEQIKAALMTMFNYETIDNFYYESESSTFEFTDNYAIYEANYQVITKEGNFYTYPVDFKIGKIDGKTAIIDISIGGNEND